MTIVIQTAVPADAPDCMVMRGQTRENAVSIEALRHYGITASSWAEDIEAGALFGWIARDRQKMVGYCFGASATGEVVVLALLPACEGMGLGATLLHRVVAGLRDRGHTRLFLGCSSDPSVRSHGFYRHLGWRSTGQRDAHGDEILVLESV